ncbi:unnamed protein product [Macrosiphum euphorbiae]|uniref:FLYWCH-type domain-containing protein n=1 Tax=Macrosiphum euphorbiae TaxID=13131 RepID=A0AAV0WK02_9HEMI|nr:unnamed protein product [Macrosiphum euphorbiae]
MEVIKSNKGGNKFCWRGYKYIMKHQARKRLTWRCTKERSFKCRGTMYTDLQIGHPQIGKVHSHIADKHEVNFFNYSNNPRVWIGRLVSISGL